MQEYPVPSVYLAGFDVFHPDRVGARRLSQTAVRRAWPARTVSAGCPGAGNSGPARALDLRCHLQALRSADAVLANLGCFRGAEPDSGTVFEVGFACALGKPVWAYFPEQQPLIEQIPHDSQGRCVDGFQVEDFGLPRNLMLACSWVGASSSAEQAVAALAGWLRGA
ncbi:nucleoside 2-deoxyribosyltransferase [Halopseudomonas pachastrellae]|nr:nucleoside 2-deoxyribosyltransferase [Halopseudomonas pachastrellae]